VGPALLLALLASVLNGWLVSTWIPYVHYRKYQLISSLATQVLGDLSSAAGRLELTGLALVFDPSKRESANKLKDVTIWSRSREHPYSVHAEELFFEIDPETEKVYIHVRNCEGYKVEGGKQQWVKQENLVLPLDLTELIGDRSRKEGGDSDLRSVQLISELARGAHTNPEKAWYVLHRRGCQTIAPFLMTLLGFSIGIFFKRSGRMGAFAVSLVPLLIYFGLTIATKGLVATTHVTILAWLPTGALALAAAPLLWKIFRL
jgi:lipopolysaccharide export LptBFGC system permease protein LptF